MLAPRARSFLPKYPVIPIGTHRYAGAYASDTPGLGSVYALKPWGIDNSILRIVLEVFGCAVDYLQERLGFGGGDFAGCDPFGEAHICNLQAVDVLDHRQVDLRLVGLSVEAAILLIAQGRAAAGIAV